jgi:hypothetical protein
MLVYFPSSDYSILYIKYQRFCPFIGIGSPHSPPPLEANVSPPHLGPRGQGGATFACGVGVGGPNSDEGTDTLVLYVCYNPLRYYY